MDENVRYYQDNLCPGETSFYDPFPQRNNMRLKNIAVSGYFDPLHIGHVRMIRAAAVAAGIITLRKEIYVIVNNTEQCLLKKGYEFMPFTERMEIISNIRGVKQVVPSIDTYGTIRETLRKLNPNIFMKGGNEYDENNLPEMDVCRELRIEVRFGIGGDKIQSSSNLISGRRK